MLTSLVPPTVGRRLRKLVERRLRRHGYSLVKAPARVTGAPLWDVWDWIAETADIRTILDIGANDGAYVEYLDGFFRPAAIHAFEPLASSQVKLRALQNRMPHLRLHAVALDDREGEATFFQNSYGPASSLLRASDLSKQTFPETDREVPLPVRVARLDDVLDPDQLARDLLIKIDVQGVEDRVIRGGRRVFEAARYVLIEMSFVPMYDGQPLFDEVHQQLEGLGLRLAGFKDQIGNARTGQPLFAHCLYHRPARQSSRHAAEREQAPAEVAAGAAPGVPR